MSEGSSEQTGNEQTEESVDKIEPSTDQGGMGADAPPPDEPANEAPAEIQQSPEEQPDPDDPDNQPAPPQMEAENVPKEDVPWQVVQGQEFLPEGVTAQAYFLFNGEYVLVCADGFYGNHEGNMQKLAPKVLVDNVV